MPASKGRFPCSGRSGSSQSRTGFADGEVISSEKWEAIRSQQPVAPILILGSFESPKADFIKAASVIMEVKPEPRPSDSDITIQHTVIEGQPYKLINTPGFDNPHKGNPEVFVDLAQYLQNEEFKSGVKGLIYVHNANDPLQSKSLAENLDVLFNVVLGQPALSSLTIVVVPFRTADMEYAKSIAAKIQTTDSAFSAAHKAGARITPTRLEEAEVHNIIRTSATNAFVSLRIQGGKADNLLQLIEEALGYSSVESVKAALARQEETTTQTYRPDLVAARKGLEVTQKALDEHRQSLAKTRHSTDRYQDAYRQVEMQFETEQKRVEELVRTLRETQSALEEHCQSLAETKQSTDRYKDAYMQIEEQLGTEQKRVQELTRKLQETQSAREEDRRLLVETKRSADRYQDAYRQIEMQLGTEQRRAQELTRKLQETQAEYSSLRSQLLIQENVERSEIVLGLKDLNRAIEDIGRGFSAHLVDQYASTAFNKDPMDVTTSDARDLTTLQVTFDHQGGEASFVMSSSGDHMLVEDFFDYGIRHLLCNFLWQHIFRVFHPNLDAPMNQMMASMYQGIQLREPQAASGHWRVNSFLSIEYGESQEQTKDAIINTHVNKFCDGIKAIAQAFFGQDQDIQLEPTQTSQVEKLLLMAWEWNGKLKGQVIVLGDFVQTCYEPRIDFDPNTMDEFEPRKDFKAEKILGTLGLGLTSVQAVGDWQPPEKTIECKAIVATESLYY